MAQVKINDKVKEEFLKLESSFTFPEFVQSSVREKIDRTSWERIKLLKD